MALWLYLSGYVTGLASAPYLAYSVYFPLLALLSALLYLGLLKSSWSQLPLIFFFWMLGCSFYHLEMTPPQDGNHVRAFVGESPVIVAGEVLSVTGRAGGGSTLDLAATHIVQQKIAYHVQGKVRLFIDQGEPAVAPGGRVRFRSRLRAPRVYGTPGEFDYPRHLAYLDIFTTAFLADSRELVIFAGRKDGLFHSINRLRNRIGRRIDETVQPGIAPLVRALVIGDRSELSESHRDLLAQGGISHLFAISGLHLGLVATLLYLLARAVYVRSERLLLYAPPARILPLLLIPALLAYLLLTGNAISTRRAFAMMLVAVTLLSRARQTPPLKLLASCAFLFLLAEPLILFQPAFQLSFAGLFGILWLLPHWQPWLPRRPKALRYLAGLVLSTLAATLATTPLVLANFHLWAPAALITNLFSIPAIGIGAVPLGLTGALLLPIWEDGAALLLQGCAWIIQTTLAAVELILRIPALNSHQFYAAPHILLAIFLFCAALLLLLLPKNSRRLWLWRGTFAVISLMILPASGGNPAGIAVTALSVGQGDAILLSLAGNRHFLIDGGGAFNNRFDIGERLVAPALGWVGVRSLEAVILTHDHPDHYQGLIQVLKHFRVGQFWSPVPLPQLDPELQTTLRDRNIPTVCPAPGWTSWAGGTESDPLLCFVPDQKTVNLNDRSLVLLASCGRDGVLLTGDLEERGVKQLLAKPLPRSVNLIKLPHHGSRKSHPERLLDSADPEMVFVSVGTGNRYGFPHPEVVKVLRERHIPLWRTDLQGSIRFLSNGSGWQATHWNKKLFR